MDRQNVGLLDVLNFIRSLSWIYFESVDLSMLKLSMLVLIFGLLLSETTLALKPI